jgi:DNA-binding transcriptional MerR regulator
MVKEVSNIVGISVRMLHYYDNIGLLKPSSISPAGYRLYYQNDLEKLQEILFFKELDFSLSEIKDILSNPGFDRKQALKSQKELLIKKRNRLNKIIKTLDNTLESVEGGIEMDNKKMFEGFDMGEIEEQKKKYAKEVEERWGNTNAYRESQKKSAKYDKNDWAKITEDGDKIFKKLASLIDRNAEDPEVQESIEAWRNHISKYFYECTPEILRGLGEMYVNDSRFTENIDKYGKGLSVFLRDAIQIYCDNHK